MNSKLRWAKVAVIGAAFVLVVAACGGDSDEGEVAPAPTTVAAGNEDPAVLPPNPDPGDDPATAGACLEGEPDCNDIGVITDEPLDLPIGSDDEPGDVVTGSGALVDGGLTVSEALDTTATGIIAVQGFLLDDGSGARLCELLAESMPPQCGGASVSIENFEEVLGVPLANAQGVTWTDSTVTFFGELVDGTLVVDPFVAG